MKTKIRSLIIICTLGLVGLINTNAVAGDKKVINTGIIVENVELLTNETSLSTDEFLKLAEGYTSLGTDTQVEKYASSQIRLIEIENAKSDLLKEAHLYTRCIADEHDTKLIQKLIDEGRLHRNK